MNYVIRGKNDLYYDGKGFGAKEEAKVYKGAAALDLGFSEVGLIRKKVPYPLVSEIIKKKSH